MKQARQGVGFCGLLALVFIVLKLVGVVNWAWWIVLSPIWGYVALVALIVAVFVIIALLKHGRE